jgi:hypothetical protein
MISDFNKAAIVEYTAAIPEAKAKPAVAFHLANFIHKLVSVLGNDYRYFWFSSANEARMSSASSNTKLDVRYKGTECSRYCVRSNWVRMASVSKPNFFFVHFFIFKEVFHKDSQRKLRDSQNIFNIEF